MKDQGLDSALQNIYQSQNIQSRAEIDCSKVTSDQFEELGDTYMEIVHPGEAHEYMDRMMGGEGSESLRQAHINMGRSYLGCWSDYNSGPVYMPMMPAGQNFGSGWGGMMGGFGWGPNMMGVGGNYGIGNMVFGSLWWVLVIIGVVTLIKWIAGRNHKDLEK